MYQARISTRRLRTTELGDGHDRVHVHRLDGLWRLIWNSPRIGSPDRSERGTTRSSGRSPERCGGPGCG